MTSSLPAVVPAPVRGLVRRGRDAVGNVADHVVHGRLADTSRHPRRTELAGAGWTLHRYDPLPEVPVTAGRPAGPRRPTARGARLRLRPAPGHEPRQLHHQIRGNDLARGALRLAGREVDLAAVTTPVLLIAGADDVIAPRAAVERATALLTRSSDLRFGVEPGGHLGVLTGRRARTHSWPRLLRFLDDHNTPDSPDADAPPAA